MIARIARASTLAVSLLSLALAAGCAATSSTDGTSAQADKTASRAEEIVRAGGDFRFSVESSGRVASLLKLRCAFKSPDCWERTVKEASLEGIRFEKAANGDLVFVSYGDGEVYHKAPFKIVSSTATSVTIEPTGKDEGTMAGQKGPDKLVIEAHDDVVALTDPVKGALVYHRVK